MHDVGLVALGLRPGLADARFGQRLSERWNCLASEVEGYIRGQTRHGKPGYDGPGTVSVALVKPNSHGSSSIQVPRFMSVRRLLPDRDRCIVSPSRSSWTIQFNTSCMYASAMIDALVAPIPVVSYSAGQARSNRGRLRTRDSSVSPSISLLLTLALPRCCLR